MKLLRLRFPAESEAAERAELDSRIDTFWAAILERQDDLLAALRRKSKWNFAEWMRAQADLIDLCWEFAPGIKREFRLVLTCEGQHAQRPLVERVIKRCPRSLAFDVYDGRLGETVEVATVIAKFRAGLAIEDWKVHAELQDDGRIDLTYFGDSSKNPDGDLIVTEALVGERILNNWVGAIDTKRKGKGMPLAQLKPAIDALMLERRAQLPTLPWGERPGAVFKLKPKEAPDYVGQRDLFVGSSVDMAVVQAMLSEAPFCSERFSRHDELFAYLKLDGSEPRAENAFEDRSELEDAIDEALGKTGTTFGGGTGLRYSYVYLALRDADAAIKRLIPVLRRLKAPKRTWLLFCDDSLRAEWVGTWKETPPPPSEEAST